MNEYLILANPGHNRIYFETALKIAISELRAIGEAHGLDMRDIELAETALPASIKFTTNRELTEEEFKTLGTSSVFYALFELVDSNLLKPINVPDFHTFPESMVQILKYNGKTNEQFTRLMVNLALSACKTTTPNKTLLDPMCGKGTTLYEGYIRGLDVTGIEVNSKWSLEIKNYVTRYFKEGKYKHRTEKSKRVGAKGKKIADVFSVKAAVTKEDFKNEKLQQMQVFTADTSNADKLLKKKSFDVIVCDLPYGVQHGMKNKMEDIVSRSPLALLKKAVPAWKHVMRVNGSMVLAYNELTVKYGEIAKVLSENGLEVLDEEPYADYIHRVDQSINRNLIVAVKKN